MLNNYKENGYALVQSLVLLVVSSIIIGAMITLSRYSMAEYKIDSDYDSALLLAISGLEKTKHNISDAFRNYLYDLPDSGAAYKINWFDDLDKYTGSGVDPKYHVETPTKEAFKHTLDEAIAQNDDKKCYWRTEGNYTVTLSSVMPKDPKKNRKDPSVRYVKIRVEATVGDNTRTIEEIVKYGIESVIAQYAYFQNQPMFVKPTAMMRFNGDLRSNGNMTFMNNDGRIAGDVYASVCPDFGNLGIGNITGRVSAVPLGLYNTNVTSKQARPIYDEGYLYGYRPLDDNGGTPRVREFENEPQINVPPLGNLEDYKEDGAWIKQAGKTLVDEVHSSSNAGVDGIAGSPDDGSIYLEGTRDNPIEIDGSVVIEGDVIIKGYIKGHGSIYASKNIHVIGDIKYVNPPQWNKPGSKVDNQLDKDLVGFMAKGNILFGNSEKINSNDALLKAAYPHDAPLSDAENGFDSDYNSSNGVSFDGDYSKFAKAYDDEKKKVVDLNRIDIPARDAKTINKKFSLGGYIRRVQVTPPVYGDPVEKLVKTKVKVWNGKWKTEQYWTGKWIDDPNAAISSGGNVPKIKEMATRQVKVYEKKTVWQKKMVKPIIKPATYNNVYTTNWQVIKPPRSAPLDCGPDTIDRVREIRPGDKLKINGDIYTVASGSNSRKIVLKEPLKRENGATSVTINSVELLKRNYTVTPRRYYEPAVEGRFLRRNADDDASHFDGVYFTNHLVGGLLEGIKINGSIITRDSAFKISNSAEFNWDMRLAVSHGTSNMATIIGLPKNHSNVSVYWREL